MKKYYPFILVVAFLCGLSAYNLRFWLWKDAFYHLIAVEFVLLYGLIWLYATGVWRFICQVFLLACVNSLIDELFFDPSAIMINEYIGFGVIILITMFYAFKKLGKRLGS